MDHKNENLFSIGSENKRIVHFDIRSSSKPILSIECHDGQVCGLKWSEEQHYLVSGGNDNKVNVFDDRKMEQAMQELFYHRAAVKSI